MIALRLRLIETVDFRCSEVTNYKAIQKKYRTALNLGGDDVVLLVSTKKNQLIFVYSEQTVETKTGLVAEVTRSVRLRLSRGTWEPLMLQNYANQVGIALVGIKLFEEFMSDVRKVARRAA